MQELCKLSKSALRDQLPELVAQMSHCTYICRKCARVAPKKSWLCKPVAVRKLDPECTEITVNQFAE